MYLFIKSNNVLKMKILFLDQSSNLGGAELNLLDTAKLYRDSCLVALFADGSFAKALEENKIPTRILLNKPLKIYKDSSFWQSIQKTTILFPLIAEIIELSRNYDLIYANTQKALVVGAIASLVIGRPLVYHLHDILSLEHFSQSNRRIAVFLANRFASLIIANSQATKTAFIESGGKEQLVKVIYNGFDLAKYDINGDRNTRLKQELNLEGRYIVGHFSRLSPWKGQHILIEALTHCPEATAILVGDALFGEQEYVAKLHQQTKNLELGDRVHFLGFRSDIPQLMSMCDLVVHTSTAPEPFGRVIVEAMLCGKPIIAAAAGTSFWTAAAVAAEITKAIARAGQTAAGRRFDLSNIEQQIDGLLKLL